MTEVRKLGEWGLLDRFLPALGRSLPARFRVPPGDDAAVVRTGSGLWAVTTDMLVEGVHFDLRWTSGEDLGHKSLAANLSDLAAMGNVAPDFGVVSLGISPRAAVDFVDGFHRGIRRLSRRHGFHLVGGDTVRSDKVVVSIAALGRVKGRPVLRNGARPGDVLLVTGTLGDAAAGLDIVRRRPSARGFLVRRLRRPVPRLDLAPKLAAAGVTALMDSSDGLWRSVNILCRASGTGARIEAERLPLSPALKRWARSPGDYALAGGEDYELVMAAPPRAAAALEAKGWARAVGTFLPRGEGIRITEMGRPRPAPREFIHF